MEIIAPFSINVGGRKIDYTIAKLVVFFKPNEFPSIYHSLLASSHMRTPNLTKASDPL